MNRNVNSPGGKDLMRALLFLALAALAPLPAAAETTLTLQPSDVSDWKAVYARVEARDTIAARARLGGTLTEISVTEGDTVQAGQPIGQIVDEKIEFQLGAVDAQLKALASQLANAEAELKRGEELLSRGVTTAQALDALRTQVSVLTNQIAAQQAQRQVIEQQAAEGTVLAPISGRVLEVPQTLGAVVMAGETVASIGGGGFFLRLAVPERHAAALKEGDAIQIEAGGIDAGGAGQQGKLVKLYPQISNGRVVADVEVEGMDAQFVDARVLVRLPVGKRPALLVPEAAVTTRSGLDFVAVRGADGALSEHTVVLGERHVVDGQPMVEVVTGLAAGDAVVTGNE